MNKIIWVLLIFIFQYQIGFAQVDSLKLGLKGKIIRSIGHSSNSPEIFYAGIKGKDAGSGKIYKSIDYGKTWNPLNDNKGIGSNTTDIQSIAISSTLNEIIYVGTWKNGLYKSKDGGKTFMKDTNCPSSDIRDIKVGIQNDSLVYLSTSSMGIIKSINGGKTWLINNSEIIDSTFKFAWSIEIDKTNDSIIYAQTMDKGIWKSINQGETWEHILDTKGKVCWDMKISNRTDDIWVASSKQGDTLSEVYHSTDNGGTWNSLKNIPQIAVNQIEILDDNRLIIGSWADGVYILNDENWEKEEKINFGPISEIIVHKNGVLIGSWGNGVYKQ